MCNPSQDFHGSNPTLSPTAQAVLDAVREICPAPADEIAATAIRELMNQVAPQPPRFPTCKYMDGYLTAKQRLRMRSLAIADELEGLANG